MPRIFDTEQADANLHRCSFFVRYSDDVCQLVYGHAGDHFHRIPTPPVLPLTTRPVTRYESVLPVDESAAGNQL